MCTKKIKIGPAGWDYPDWQGIVYPTPSEKGFNRLTFIASCFELVEVNTSFYQPPKPNVVFRWLEQVKSNEKFLFTAKLWQKFTHTEDPIERGDRENFLASMRPLLHANKLAAVLIQFPWRFKNAAKSRDRLLQIMDFFSELPLVAEFRHESWLCEEIFALLRSHRTGFANIDQPVIGQSIAPGHFLSSDIGYVRFHGRNYNAWFAKDSNRDERYNYLYGENELSEWSERIRNMEQNAQSVFIIFNNHYRGQAIVNSFQMMADLLGEPVQIPEPIITAYPVLQKIARPMPASKHPHDRQGELF